MPISNGLIFLVSVLVLIPSVCLEGLDLHIFQDQQTIWPFPRFMLLNVKKSMITVRLGVYKVQ